MRITHHSKELLGHSVENTSTEDQEDNPYLPTVSKQEWEDPSLQTKNILLSNMDIKT